MNLPEITGISLSLDGMIKGITCTIPEIKLDHKQVPVGTKKLSLILEDTHFGNLPHGMQLVNFTGLDIDLKNTFIIFPLNPPLGKTHEYRLTLQALDKNNSEIGAGSAIQAFS